MTEQHRDEKAEKQEKQEEKDEKSRDEKWRRDPLGGIVWAIILIWGGIVFLASSMKLLRGLEFRSDWGLFFIGAGVILLMEVLLRLLIPEYRRPFVGTIILGVVFIAIGLERLGTLVVDWGVFAAIGLIVGGVAILLSILTRRK